MEKENKRKARDEGDRDSGSKRHNGGSSSKPNVKPPSSTAQGPHRFPPPLTAPERTLLNEHDGCTKCRCFFANHRAAQCNNDPPAADGYKELSQADVDAARRVPKGKAPVVAAVMPSYNDSNDSADDGDVTESSEVSPASSPNDDFAHLIWRCLLEGPKSALPIAVNALIDNSSHLVIINDSLADSLGLRRFTLHRPKEITLALSDDSLPTVQSLTQYVKLRTVSTDQSWTSNSVCAFIAPGLCAPLILGLP
jgi:hypothetical protein